MLSYFNLLAFKYTSKKLILYVMAILFLINSPTFCILNFR